LSCPFVNGNDACALFTICLGLFLADRSQHGRVIALDEAHKFLTQSGEALEFTEQLESIIRQQRHLGTRVLIATQEPTLAPSLLDLCDVTIVHRFRSPAWFEVLKHHLAGARTKGNPTAINDIFRIIIDLRVGEALLFSPTSILDLESAPYIDASRSQNVVVELQDAFIRIRIRDRITADGGKDIMASDAVEESNTEAFPSSDPKWALPGNGNAILAPMFKNNAVHNAFRESPSGSLLSAQTVQTNITTSQPQAQASSQQNTTNTLLQQASLQPGRTITTAPKSDPIASCVRRHVYRLMREDSTALDFGTVRRAVEAELRRGPGTLTKEHESTNVIKRAVEKYIEDHKLPPPKWANWIR